MPDIQKRIESYLDEQIKQSPVNQSRQAFWCELAALITLIWRALIEFIDRFFWFPAPAFRRELTEHLIDSYERWRGEGLNDEEAWQRVTERFGEAGSVAQTMRLVHRPERQEWLGRLLALVVVAIGAGIGWHIGWWRPFDVIDTTVAGIAFFGFLLFLVFSREYSWRRIQAFVIWTSMVGVFSAFLWFLFLIQTPRENIQYIGIYLAITYTSVFYLSLLASPRYKTLLLMTIICHVEMILTLRYIYPSGELYHFATEAPFHLLDIKMIAGPLAVFLAVGWALYGPRMLARRLPHLSVAMMVLLHIQVFNDLNDTSQVIAQFSKILQATLLVGVALPFLIHVTSKSKVRRLRLG